MTIAVVTDIASAKAYPREPASHRELERRQIETTNTPRRRAMPLKANTRQLDPTSVGGERIAKAIAAQNSPLTMNRRVDFLRAGLLSSERNFMRRLFP